jgi:hypothetical protein
MTSRELVRRAIRFESPDRLPFTGSMGDTDFTGDTVALFPDTGLKWWLGGGGTDEWGSRWEIEPGSKDMGQVRNTVLPDLARYPELAIPDASRPERYADWPEALDRAEREGKYVVVCNGPYIFERAHFLHGFENTLVDLLAEPELMTGFLRRLAEYHLKTLDFIREHFPGRVHGYRGTDDWGTQSATLVAPDVFRAVFQPIYRDLFAAIRSAGMDVWMHSCGQIVPLLDDWIKAGLQVVNLMQPNALPISALAPFRGRICFEICADAQTTLLGNDTGKLKAEIAEILETCATPQGGLIEVKLDRMYYDGDGVAREMGELCHAEYRRLDPYRRAG